MPKLIVMYPQPTDVATFDRRYKEEHLPMAGELLTGVTGLTITKGLAAPDGNKPQYHTIATVEFGSMEDLQGGLGSADGQKVAAHAVEISTGGPPVFVIGEDEG